MKFKIKPSSTTNIEKLVIDCFICTSSSLSKLKLPQNTLEYIKNIINQEELHLDTNINKSILLFNVPNLAATRLLLISTGKEHKLSDFQFLTMIKNIYSNLNKYNINNITLCLNNLHIKNRNFNWQFYQTITDLKNNLYTFDGYKSKKSNNKNFILRSMAHFHHKAAHIFQL